METGRTGRILFLITRFNEKLHIVEVWLTNEDQQNNALMDALLSCYQDWNTQGYTPVLFRSGSHDLYEDMLQLLKKWRLAEAESQVQAEKRVSRER